MMRHGRSMMGRLTPGNAPDMASRPGLRGERARRRLAIVVVLMIPLSLLVLGGTASAAPAPSLWCASLQQEDPVCQDCHSAEYDLWKTSTHAAASLDPEFQEQLAMVHNQEECLTCHATGVQAGSGMEMANGVTCEACHGAYQDDHPASATMKLPVESSATCRTCHEAACSEWDTSAHAEKNIECFDCHLAHTQGVRTGSVDTLCAACHSDQGTQAAHSRHGINGVNCVSCHMSEQIVSTAGGEAGAQISASSHSFKVTADVCSQCHGSTIHATGDVKSPGDLQVSDTQTEVQFASATDKGVEELRAEVDGLQKRLTSLRDAAVIGIGLALAVGGFMGLVVGLVGMGIWKRNRGSA